MKNNEYILYLDMDGVTVDWVSGYKKLLLNRKKGMPDESIVDFWANLDWIRGGKELLKAANELFENVCILSSAGSGDEERSKINEVGKRVWIDKNIPEMSQDKVFIVYGKVNKQKFANKMSILVDDVLVSIVQWKRNGGYGIHHNDLHYNKTIEELEDIARPMNIGEIAKRLISRRFLR